MPSSPRFERDRVFLSLLFARASLPTWADTVVRGRSSDELSVTVANTSSSAALVTQLLGLALTFALAAACVARVINNLDRPPGRVGSSWKFFLLVLTINAATVLNGSGDVWLLLPLFVAGSLALVPASPSTASMILRRWICVVAAANLLAGILLPNVALFSDESRRTLLRGRLAGLESHPNALGLLLALGLPFLISEWTKGKLSARWLAVSAFALIATSSRTALVAGIIGSILVLVAARRSAKGRPGAWARGTLAALAGLSIWPAFSDIPGVFRGDGRVEIWHFARSEWTARWLLGHGVDAWRSFASSKRIDVDFAFHAHNQWLDLLIVGGVAACVAGALWTVGLCRAAIVSSSATPALLGFAGAFLVEMLSEVPIYTVALDSRFVFLVAVSTIAANSRPRRSAQARTTAVSIIGAAR